MMVLPAALVFNLSLLLLLPPAAATAAPPLLRAVDASDAGFGQRDNGSIVIGHDKAGPLNITGIEGSFYTRTSDGTYHFLSGGEMKAPEGMDYWESDIHMRFDHWQSPDGMNNWTWTAKIYESSGVFDGTDRRGSTWAPMAAFDKATDTWHLFYVAYRASPAYRTPLGLYRDPKTHKPQALHAYTQFDGEIYHAVSTVRGERGISGPYKDIGPVLDQEDLGGFDPDVDTWEGDHGCDSECGNITDTLSLCADQCNVISHCAVFFPFQLDDGSWLALFGSELGRFPHFWRTRQVGLAKFTPSSNSTAAKNQCKLLKQYSAETCVEGTNFGCNPENQTFWWVLPPPSLAHFLHPSTRLRGHRVFPSPSPPPCRAKGCRGKFQCGRAQVSCGATSHHPPSCELSCQAGAFSGNWTRLSELNPLDAGFRPATPGIENPVVVRSQDKQWWISVYHIYTGATIGVSYSQDGLHWVRQAGDLQLGDSFCGDSVTTACGLVPEPSKGKGVYSLLYTASGKCSSGLCESENVCRAFLINTAERDAL